MIQAVTARTFGGGRARGGDGRVSAETRDVAADLPGAAAISAVADLLPEHGGVRAAGVPSLAQAGGVLVAEISARLRPSASSRRMSACLARVRPVTLPARGGAGSGVGIGIGSGSAAVA
jgi:hypothetical protein